MGQSERKQAVTPEDVRDTFDQRDDPSEPLTTSEVADALGCSHRTVRKILHSLAEQGELATKEMDNQARVWWRTNAAAATLATEMLKQTPDIASETYKHAEGVIKTSTKNLYNTFKLFFPTKLLSRYLKTTGLNENRHEMNDVPNNINPSDPFWETSGMLSSEEPSDVSSNVDRYLYSSGNDE